MEIIIIIIDNMTTLIINSLAIFGIHALFTEGYILGQIGDRIRTFSEKYNTEYFPYGWISKPLIDCPPCMASFWGITGFFFTGLDWFYLPVYLLSLAGLNYIINGIIYQD